MTARIEYSGWIYLFAILTSFLLSAFIVSHETIINPDAICYLMSAQAFGVNGLSSAMHLCGQAEWPFYSVLIHFFSACTHISYPASAYYLNAIFSAMTVCFFLMIVHHLGANRRILLFAAFTILLAHEFNSVRQYIVRDHGFWAFYLASVYCLLLYVCQPRFLTVIAWGGCSIVATLFRIEGILFLGLIPFIVFFNTSWPARMRWKAFFQLHSLSLILALALGVWLLVHPQKAADKLGRLPEVMQQFEHGMTVISERLVELKTNLTQHFLTKDSARDAGIVLFLLMLSWYFVSVIINLSWIYSGLILIAWHKKIARFLPADQRVLIAYIFLNMIVTFCFLLERMFLSKRYLVALTLILMLWVPFALNYLWLQRKQFILAMVSVLMVASAAGGIVDFGYSKAYVRDAGDWIAGHVPASATLYVNDYQLMYYSQHFNSDIFIKLRQYMNVDTIAQGRWKHYDYLALRLDKTRDPRLQPILEELNLRPTTLFQNKRGDKVIIYKISSSQ